MSDENKENIEQKQEKQRIWNKILSLFSIGNLKKIWQKIWGKDLPEDITEIFPDDKSKSDVNINLYNKLKRNISLKRFIVVILMLLFSIVIFNSLFWLLGSYYKDQMIFSCLDKPVCIYKDFNIDIGSDKSKLIIEKYKELIFVINETVNYKSKPKQSKFEIKIYDVKKKKVIKKLVKNYEHFSFSRVFPLSKNEILFYFDFFGNNFIQYIYNINENEFRQVKIDSFENSYLLSHNEDGLLFMSNSGQSKSYYKGQINEDSILSNKESLYYLNFKNLKVKKFPDFAKQPKYLPQREDILILDNGKIIIPIRINDVSLLESGSLWDHIELYLPESNKFLAIMDTKPLENNLFNIKLKNGDILFLNVDSTYIFKNDENKFILASLEEIEKNKVLVEQISNVTDYSYGEKIKKNLLNKHKFIKVDDYEYLITCGNGVNFRRDYLCNKTVYVDYAKSIVAEGPKFLSPHRNSRIYKNDNNLFVLGGYTYNNKFQEIRSDDVQIIKKNWR